MPGSPPPNAPLDAEVHSAYEKRRRYRRLSILVFVTIWLLAFLTGLGKAWSVPDWVVGLGFLGMGACVIVGILAWRCPRCGYQIAGGHSFSSQSRFCWKCGVRLS